MDVESESKKSLIYWTKQVQFEDKHLTLVFCERVYKNSSSVALTSPELKRTKYIRQILYYFLQYN